MHEKVCDCKITQCLQKYNKNGFTSYSLVEESERCVTIVKPDYSTSTYWCFSDELSKLVETERHLLFEE